MIIDKVLNNNVVVTKDASGAETIFMGRGIEFKKKVGDFIDSEMIDKEFRLTTNEAKSKFEELIVDIPLEIIELSEEIVAYAKTYLGKQLNEMLYISRFLK